MASSRRLVRCQKCSDEFDISYARAFGCGSCPSLVQCAMVKCPTCGHEFPNPTYPQV